MSSGSPSSHAAKPGAASRLFSRIASAKRSFAGKNDSRSSTPIALHRRLLDLLDQRGEVEVLPVLPGVAEDRREQDVLAALDRVGVDAEQAEQAGRGRGDALAEQLAVVEDRLLGRGERLEDRHGDARRCCRACRSRSRRRRAAAGCGRRPGPSSPGPSSTAPPAAAANCSGVDALLARVVLVDPRPKSSGARFGKRQQQVGEVALGVDDDRGDAVDRGLFEQRDAQAGLAAAGHADADGVGDEVLASRTGSARRRLSCSPGRTRGRGRRRRASRNRSWAEILLVACTGKRQSPRRLDAVDALEAATHDGAARRIRTHRLSAVRRTSRRRGRAARGDHVLQEKVELTIVRCAGLRAVLPQPASAARAPGAILSAGLPRAPHAEAGTSSGTRLSVRIRKLLASEALRSPGSASRPESLAPSRQLCSRLRRIRPPRRRSPGSAVTGKLLDFGCGHGKLLRRMRAAGWDVVGLDFSEQAVERRAEPRAIAGASGNAPAPRASPH